MAERGAYRIASVAAWGSVFALDTSQYAHTSWKVRDGFANSSFTQLHRRPRGYLWLGTEAGLLRFDGMRAVSWPRPTAQELPSKNIETRSLDRQIHLCIILPREGFRSCTSAQTELRVQSGGSRSLWPRHFELARKQFPRAMHHVYSDAASQVPLSVHTRTYAPALGFNMYGPVKDAVSE